MTESSRKDFISLTLVAPYDITRRDIQILQPRPYVVRYLFWSVYFKYTYT